MWSNIACLIYYGIYICGCLFCIVVTTQLDSLYKSIIYPFKYKLSNPKNEVSEISIYNEREQTAKMLVM